LKKALNKDDTDEDADDGDDGDEVEEVEDDDDEHNKSVASTAPTVCSFLRDVMNFNFANRFCVCSSNLSTSGLLLLVFA